MSQAHRSVPLRGGLVVVAVGLCMVAASGMPTTPSPPVVIGVDPCTAVGVGGGAHLRFESDSPASFVTMGGYVVRYDAARRQPTFTVHVLRPEAITADGRRPAVRRSGFRVETLPEGELSARDRDYTRTGYDRGHLVPAGDFLWDQTAKDETFSYLNVAPFNPNLNRGAWAALEGAVRARVVRTGEAAYVVTGSLFVLPTEPIGPDALAVPSHFYKIAYFPASGSAYAFLFDNTVTGYVGDLSDFQTTVDFVEGATGQDFYDLLDDECEADVERARPRLAAHGLAPGRR